MEQRFQWSLRHSKEDTTPFSQLLAVKTFHETIRKEGIDGEFFYGNSSAVRLGNIFSDQYIYVNRGVNGIEGSAVNGCWICYCTSGRRGCVLCYSVTWASFTIKMHFGTSVCHLILGSYYSTWRWRNIPSITWIRLFSIPRWYNCSTS